MELKKKKKKLRRFRLALSAAILFTAAGIGCLIGSAQLKKGAYRELTQMSPSTQAEQRRSAYLRAIRLEPSDPNAYLCLLDVYNEDGLFEKAESEEFLAAYNTYHTKLNLKDPGCAQLFYRAGILYINGYDANTTTRLRMAIPFLESAQELLSPEMSGYTAVNCYCSIGSFYRDYIWDAASSVREVNPGQMEALLEQITNTLTAFRSDSDAESVYNRLGFCLAAGNLLYDQRDTLAATIPYEITTKVLAAIYADLPSMETLQKEHTRELLATLLENQEMYTDMIDRAYGRALG